MRGLILKQEFDAAPFDVDTDEVSFTEVQGWKAFRRYLRNGQPFTILALDYRLYRENHDELARLFKGRAVSVVVYNVPPRVTITNLRRVSSVYATPLHRTTSMVVQAWSENMSSQMDRVLELASSVAGVCERGQRSSSLECAMGHVHGNGAEGIGHLTR